jgi:hypothetical protein
MTGNPELQKLRLWLARQLLCFAQLSGRSDRSSCRSSGSY